MVHSVTSPETHGLEGNDEVNMGSKSVYLRQYVTRLCVCEGVKVWRGRVGRINLSLAVAEVTCENRPFQGCRHVHSWLLQLLLQKVYLSSEGVFCPLLNGDTTPS